MPRFLDTRYLRLDVLRQLYHPSNLCNFGFHSSKMGPKQKLAAAVARRAAQKGQLGISRSHHTTTAPSTGVAAINPVGAKRTRSGALALPSFSSAGAIVASKDAEEPNVVRRESADLTSAAQSAAGSAEHCASLPQANPPPRILGTGGTEVLGIVSNAVAVSPSAGNENCPTTLAKADNGSTQPGARKQAAGSSVVVQHTYIPTSCSFDALRCLSKPLCVASLVQLHDAKPLPAFKVAHPVPPPVRLVTGREDGSGVADDSHHHDDRPADRRAGVHECQCFDPRDAATLAFDDYVHYVTRLVHAGYLEGRSPPIPLAITTGSTGSGKRTLLKMLGRRYEMLLAQPPGSRAVYVTMNIAAQEFERNLSMGGRVVLHLLAALLPSVESDPESVFKHLNAIAEKPQELSRWLYESGEPEAAMVRHVLGMPDTANLLILFNLQHDASLPPGSRCPKTKDALKKLSLIIQRGARWAANGAADRGVTHVGVATLSAGNPVQRFYCPGEVHWLPLPPLSPRYGWDAAVQTIGALLPHKGMSPQRQAAALAHGRRTLWRSSLHDASSLNVAFDALRHATHLRDFFRVSPPPLSQGLASAAEALVTGREATRLLQSMFWPTYYKTNDRVKADRPQLQAESLGLCALVRDHEAHLDAVYVSPAFALELCLLLRNDDEGQSLPFLPLVERLCKTLLANASPRLRSRCPVRDAKLYQDVVALAFACRAATAPHWTRSVGEFIGVQPTACRDAVQASLALAIPAHGHIVEVETIDATQPLPKNWFSMSTNRNSGGHDAALLSLPLAEDYDGRTRVCFDFHALPLNAAASSQASIASAGSEASAFAKRSTLFPESHVLRVILMPTTQSVSFLPQPTQAFPLRLGDVIVTDDDIRRWSPTVAYSVCDARTPLDVTSGWEVKSRGATP